MAGRWSINGRLFILQLIVASLLIYLHNIAQIVKVNQHHKTHPHITVARGQQIHHNGDQVADDGGHQVHHDPQRPLPDSSVPDLLPRQQNLDKDESPKPRPWLRNAAVKLHQSSTGLVRLLRDSELLLCPSNRRPHLQSDGTPWQQQDARKSGGIIFVYSAFYDDNASPSVKLIVLASGIHSVNVYCHMWYSEVIEPCVVKAKVFEVDTNGRMTLDEGQVYGQFVMTCRLPESLSHAAGPQHVSLATGSTCGSTISQSAVLVEIYYPDAAVDKPQLTSNQFVVCAGPSLVATTVSKSRDQQLVPWLVEWIELQLMFGVTQIFLYSVFDDDIIDNKLINYYGDRKSLDVRRIPHPVLTVSARRQEVVLNLRSLAVNDCLLRAAALQSRYALVVNLDELIVPRSKSTNYTDMLVRVQQMVNSRGLTDQSTRAVYKFPSLTFNLDLPANDSTSGVPALLTTGRYWTRQKKTDLQQNPGHVSNSGLIVDCQLCKNLLSNGVCGRLLESSNSVDVPLNIGANHRYHKVQQQQQDREGEDVEGEEEEGERNEQSADLVQDRAMMKFQPQAKLRVIQTLKSSQVVDPEKLYQLALLL